MKSFVLALASMVVIAIGASVLLNSGYQKSATEAYATQGARVGTAH
ncbi:MAG TPA: hypothetical protein PKW21_03470 [Rhabdaerophilum sp.]|nr:hypothetical protein [Rhabdaerophilum sp.]